MLRIWNVALVIVTFFLTIFGTFMTRSGVVQSVHAFGEDSVLALLFIVFMVVDPDVQLRPGHLPAAAAASARNELDSWLSREAAFLVNNWILLFSAFFVLFATMFPTISEALTGTRLTVAGAVLQQVDDADRADPAVPHRRRPAARLAQDDGREPARSVPVADDASRVVTAVGAAGASGMRVWSSGLCFALCAFVVGTIVQEFWRGANVRRRNTGTDLFTALVGLVGRNKRRYGGYIVHLGIVLMFLGFRRQRLQAATSRCC